MSDPKIASSDAVILGEVATDGDLANVGGAEGADRMSATVARVPLRYKISTYFFVSTFLF